MINKKSIKIIYRIYNKSTRKQNRFPALSQQPSINYKLVLHPNSNQDNKNQHNEYFCVCNQQYL